MQFGPPLKSATPASCCSILWKNTIWKAYLENESLRVLLAVLKANMKHPYTPSYAFKTPWLAHPDQRGSWTKWEPMMHQEQCTTGKCSSQEAHALEQYSELNPMSQATPRNPRKATTNPAQSGCTNSSQWHPSPSLWLLTVDQITLTSLDYTIGKLPEPLNMAAYQFQLKATKRSWVCLGKEIAQSHSFRGCGLTHEHIHSHTCLSAPSWLSHITMQSLQWPRTKCKSRAAPLRDAQGHAREAVAQLRLSTQLSSFFFLRLSFQLTGTNCLPLKWQVGILLLSPGVL